MLASRTGVSQLSRWTHLQRSLATATRATQQALPPATSPPPPTTATPSDIYDPKFVNEVAENSDLNFNDTGLAFKNKTTFDLIRAYAVLRICGIEPLVARSEKLIGLSYSVLGKTITNFVVRHTFFKQFCAAEDEAGLIPLMKRLEKGGVSGILDYAVEADLTTHREERENEVKVRVYEYEGELACDHATEVFESCIRTAATVSQQKGTRSRPFAAIKVTALGNPKLLKRMSEMIVETRRLFQRMEDDLERPTIGSLSLEEWRLAYSKYFVDPEDPAMVDELFYYVLGREPSSGEEPPPRLDIVDWSRSMNIDVISKLVDSCKTRGPLAEVALTEEEVELSRALFGRLDRLAKLAKEQGVSLMVDAEQTYFQPCIDANVLMLQRHYNMDGTATIYNTYQCYLKSTDERLSQDLDRSKREGWKLAAKLVRGAYMVAERKLASENGYPDPIHDNIEDTHACYHRNLDVMLADADAEVMVASHNQQTCEFTVAQMSAYNIEPDSGKVHFGQLRGMSDHLTYNLGAHNYSAYKYLPYGQVHEVLPYLIRRAQENSGLMAGAVHERGLLLKEITQRINPFANRVSASSNSTA
ncbi:Proline dehydrogenase 1, mitochondrial [Hondaea fermentalgiana]|uniref:Proline dehydrogenase n=1 Tax=Hondaea fermentalgiana TaxID=2315210 RepID=A0A2R5G8D0_9STRA|nr:Proline dehydrogenase 1, mitochondrial [Hondaea fermentalgiana]|eukprot:GBG24301.1 Proline dehydrogenase 1, mitochondrial [Hondaea fermentalgiana]